MTEDKELYKRATKELLSLEQKHAKLKQDIKNIESDYHQLEKRLQKQKDKLKFLEEQKNNLPIKDWPIITFKVALPFTIIIILSWITFGFSLTHIVELLTPIITNLNKIAITFFAAFIGITGITLIEGIPTIIIGRLLIKKSIKKNKNSQEYHDTLNQIDIIKQEIEKTKKELINKQTEQKNINNEYSCNDVEINMRRALINYIDRELNTTTIIQAGKPKTRKRKPNRTNYQTQE